YMSRISCSLPYRQPTFEELVAIEPRLELLRKQARAFRPVSGAFDSLSYWLRWLKPQLCQLVGWHTKDESKPELLRTSAAYDVAYETIYEELPGCRGTFSCP